MKKVLGIAFLLAVLMVSCKKDYTCTCKYYDTPGHDTTTVYIHDNLSKSDAEDACKENQDSLQLTYPQAFCNLDFKE